MYDKSVDNHVLIFEIKNVLICVVLRGSKSVSHTGYNSE